MVAIPTELDGDKLRELRKRAALSQRELGKMSGVGQDTISELEANKHGAMGKTIRRLAQTLGVKPHELMR